MHAYLKAAFCAAALNHGLWICYFIGFPCCVAWNEDYDECVNCYTDNLLHTHG